MQTHSTDKIHQLETFIIQSKNERHASNCICCLGKNLLPSPAVLMPFIAKRVFNHDPIEISSDWQTRLAQIWYYQVDVNFFIFICRTYLKEHLDSIKMKELNVILTGIAFVFLFQKSQIEKNARIVLSDLNGDTLLKRINHKDH